MYVCVCVYLCGCACNGVRVCECVCLIQVYLTVVIPMSLDEGEGSVGVLFHKLLLVDLQRSMVNLNNRYMQAPSQVLCGVGRQALHAGHG